MLLNNAMTALLGICLLLGCQIPSAQGFSVVKNSLQPKVRQSSSEACSSSSSSALSMISFGGIGKKDAESAEVGLPRDVKEAVKKCQAAVQEALKNKQSRMDIEFPVGTKFGVEKMPKRKSPGGAPTRDVIDQSDRELARLFVEMFQPVGGENIVVAFEDQSQADLAKKKWKGDLGAASRILAMNRRKSQKKKKSKPRGFAAKLAEEIDDTPESGAFELPKGTEVALFVAPGPKELVVVEKICNEVGMGCLVILLNARLAKIENFGTDSGKELFEEGFDQVFSLTAAPQDAAPDCLLYRAYPGDWVLARKPKVGQPKPLLTQATRPSSEVCKDAYENIEVGDFEKGVEDALDNVVGWFR